MDGLSQSSVNCILQDKKGFIWLGTRDGLNKFDGYSFKSFKNEPNNPASISNNEITCLCQDDSGLLWIGTRGGGLNIYDPHSESFVRFQNRQNDPGSLKSNVVLSIFIDSKNNTWIGTTNALYKAVRINTKDSIINLSFVNVSKDIKVYLVPGFSVRNINESRNGNLLIATESGIYLFNTSTYHFKELGIPNVNDYFFTCSYQQSNNILWLGTFDAGILKVIFERNEESRIVKIERFDRSIAGFKHLNHNRVDALLADRFNNLWIATRGGLVRLNLNTNTKSVFSSDPFDERSISDNKLNSLFVDRTGVLWIGTESQGVNKYDLYKKKFYHFKSIPGNANSLSNNVVSAIYGGQKDIIWVGTDGGGIDKIDFSNFNSPQFTHYKNNPNTPGSLLSDNILSLYQDKQNTLWVGSSCNFLIKMNNGRFPCKNMTINGYIFAIMEDNLGNLWTGNWNYGLNRIDKLSGTFKNFRHIDSDPNSLSFNAIFSIYQDKDRSIWVGTKGGGLNKFIDPNANPEEAKFKIYKNDPNNPSSISHNDVYCIYQDKSGVLWVGTGGGLNKVIYIIKDNRPELTFKSYLEKDGLPNGVIYGILEDNSNNLWLSTNKGISQFNPFTEKFINYDIHDGLQANEFHQNASCMDSKGRIYFGGINGINIFIPDSIKTNPFQPQVVITNIKIMGKPAEIGKKLNGKIILKNSVTETNNIQLTFRDKEITIEFAALHFADPKKNKYKYRLIGFNDQWQEISSQARSVTYTNLDNGNYVFNVIASNNDGKWNEVPTSMNIKVLPPPWKTVWAYFFYFLIIVLLLLIFRKYSLIANEEKNNLKIEHIERTKLEELSRLKIQFFTNVSHELRTPLTLINSPLEDLLNYKKTDNYIKQQLNLMHRNTNRLLQMINQLLDFRKIDSGQLKLKISEINLIELITDIYISFSQHAKARNINLHFMHQDENIQLWIDKEKIATVFYNILSNAFKFSLDKSSIVIEVSIAEKSKSLLYPLKKFFGRATSNQLQYVVTEIRDNGIGIEKQHLEKIFDRFYQVSEKENQKFEGSGIGLAIAREYIKMHGGLIEVDSIAGEGSSFKVSLPIGKKHLDATNVTFIEQHDSTNTIDTLLQSIQKASAEEEKVEAELLTDSDQNNLSKLLILIVEDNIEMLEYIGSKLAPKYKIIKASNGAKGMEMAIEKNPDLIIADLMMPEMDGIELCKRIKTDINTSHIPIIILTAKSTEESVIEGLETGADVYISKPFNFEILKAQIKTLLDSRQKMRLNFTRQLILEPKVVTITSTDERFLQKLMDVVEHNLGDVNFGIKELTQSMGMSHSVIFRKTKSLTGLNVVEFIRSIRLKKAALILKKNKLPISEVSYMVGFSDPKYFSKCFIKEFGITPSEYSNNNEIDKTR